MFRTAANNAGNTTCYSLHVASTSLDALTGAQPASDVFATYRPPLPDDDDVLYSQYMETFDPSDLGRGSAVQKAGSQHNDLSMIQLLGSPDGQLQVRSEHDYLIAEVDVRCSADERAGTVDSRKLTQHDSRKSKLQVWFTTYLRIIAQ